MATNIRLADGTLLNVNTTPFGGVRIYAEDDCGDKVVIRLTANEVAQVCADLTERVATASYPAREPEHTLRPGSDMFHTMDCPGCADTPFTLSPRSETYWSS